MNNFEKAQATLIAKHQKLAQQQEELLEKSLAKQSDEHEKLTRENEALRAELASIDEMFGIENSAYREKKLQGIKDEFDLRGSRLQNLKELGNTNTYSNLCGKLKTAFSNEPAPPTEAELAYVEEQKALEESRIEKAKTIKVWDTIVEAAGMWSKDGQTAPDVELAIKSALFPTVYERVMKGNSDYYLETIPEAKAEKLVRQAHELIRDTRAEKDVFVTDPRHWDDLAPRFQSWVIESMLPELYGAKDKAWLTDEPLSLDQMQTWRDKEASRALDLPTIFDAYDNLKQVSDEHGTLDIGIAEFHKLTLETRIDTELPISC